MILEEIVQNKADELEMLRGEMGYADILGEFKRSIQRLRPTRDFAASLASNDGIRIIAEVKKASPSKGVIRADFDPLSIGKGYEENGAAAISVLTEEVYFQGSLEYLLLVKSNTKIPVLRKDFIIDEFHVYESRASGADAILLIAAILEEAQLKDLLDLSTSLGMATLVEVHEESEVESALKSGAKIIGINNRNLKTFKTDINTTKRLAPLIPKDRIIVSESGINSHADIISLKEAGVNAFLVGESLMRENDFGKKLRELRGA